MYTILIHHLRFNIPIDKRHVYDHDVRIHMLLTGPGIKPGSTFAHLGTNVDVVSTWLGLAGIEQAAAYLIDGRSIVPLVVNTTDAAGRP
jgi:N-acetylglucosamine-6-sulfatase